MNLIILQAIGAMVLFGLVDFFTKKAIDAGIDANVIFFYTGPIYYHIR